MRGSYMDEWVYAFRIAISNSPWTAFVNPFPDHSMKWVVLEPVAGEIGERISNPLIRAFDLRPKCIGRKFTMEVHAHSMTN